MRKNLGFRSWYYFRVGWTNYFAFIFAAINTLTVTYYLAIENLPELKTIFPTFSSYILIIGIISIPILVIIGWIHFRRTAAYGSEAEIQIESNPYYFKAIPGWNKDVMFPTLLKITEFMIRTTKNEKLSEKDISELTQLQTKLNTLISGGMVGSPRKTKDIFEKNDNINI